MALQLHSYYQPRLRFQGAASGPSLEQLRRGSRAGELCLSAQAPVSDARGNTVIATLMPTVPSDADDVRRWYGRAGHQYDDPKWCDWWVDKIRHGESGVQLHKLMVNGEVLGVVMTEKVYDRQDNTASLLVRGLRISPQCNADIVVPPRYRGVGSAIITLLVAEALKSGVHGVSVNSSVGVESFYEHLMGPQKGKAFDGVRSYFSLKGDEARAFLEKQIAAWQKKLG